MTGDNDIDTLRSVDGVRHESGATVPPLVLEHLTQAAIEWADNSLGTGITAQDLHVLQSATDIPLAPRESPHRRPGRRRLRRN